MKCHIFTGKNVTFYFYSISIIQFQKEKMDHLFLSIKPPSDQMYYKEKILTLPVKWSGTFVAMRIKKGVKGFSIYSFLLSFE